MTTYKTWYKKRGYRLEEELIEWLDSMPSWVNPNDLGIYDLDSWVKETLENRYNLEIDFFGNIEGEE